MKRLITFSLLLFTFSFAFADQEIMDIRPAASPEKALTGVDWENKNDELLKKQTTDEVLSAFCSSSEKAKSLLANVKGAYLTDPLTARQIAAVTQWVMVADEETPWYDFWSGTPRADGREVWVAALVETAEAATDSYVKEFCLDQLRWCGYECPGLVGRIRAIGEKSGDKAVKDFADVVTRELEGKGIGR